MPTELIMHELRDTAANRLAVTHVIMGSPDYHLTVDGALPNSERVDDFFTSVPAGYTLNDLSCLGFFSGDNIAGIGGVLRRWNAPNKAIIGLLLFHPDFRRRGFGAIAVAQIEALARTWPGIDRLRIGVVTTNADAMPFWEAQGFVRNGEIKPGGDHFTGDIVILEKPLYPVKP
jgi:GNAT superfamily N-acetyltransferase